MGVIYSPLLLITALVESCNARQIRLNQRQGEDDNNHPEEWEYAATEVSMDLEADAWKIQVSEVKPNVEISACELEVQELKAQVKELSGLVRRLVEQSGSGGGGGGGYTNGHGAGVRDGGPGGVEEGSASTD